MSLLLRYDLPRAGSPTIATTILASDMSGFSTEERVSYSLDCRACLAHSPTLPIPDTEGARTGAFEFFLKTFVLSSSCLSLIVSFTWSLTLFRKARLQIGLCAEMRSTRLTWLALECYTFRHSGYARRVRARSPRSDRRGCS